MMKIRLLLLVAFTLLFNACTAPSIPQPVETELPSNQTSPTLEPTQPPVQVEPSPASENTAAITMATYTDEFAGFSIDYPADWFIDASATSNAEQSFAYSVGIATWDVSNPPTPSGKGQNGIPEGGTKIDVGVVKQAMTLEEAVAQQAQNESGSPILAQENITLGNGLPAVILDFEGPFGLIRTMIIVLNGNTIYVSGYGDLENFETIALSLRAR